MVSVTTAEAQAEAAGRGETLTDLSRAEAALPGLRETVGQLKELALIATSTLGARIFDTVVKESGFWVSKIHLKSFVKRIEIFHFQFRIYYS